MKLIASFFLAAVGARANLPFSPKKFCTTQSSGTPQILPRPDSRLMARLAERI
jgi:hypothetical protein